MIKLKKKRNALILSYVWPLYNLGFICKTKSKHRFIYIYTFKSLLVLVILIIIKTFGLIKKATKF